MLEKSPPFGFNIIGYASANCGLGNTLRQFVDNLIASGEKVCILDINTGNGNSDLDKRQEHLFVSSANELPYAINLLIFGVVDLVKLSFTPPQGLITTNRMNVGFVWWELANLPQHLIDGLQFYDAFIAGSEFLHATLNNNITGVPAVQASHPLSIPNNIQSDRNKFGLPKDDFIVFMGFDPYSGIDRKNPFAAIEAFKLAFPYNYNCHLAIKVNYSGGGGKNIEENLQRLQNYTELDLRIHLIQESLSYHDLLCLYASCDAFISLHRSEGLGLVPLEAMRLGKPVVATAWSGNMSFMNYSNSCLVDFELVAIEADVQTYGSNDLGIKCEWAEPNVTQAAAWLQKLSEDTTFRSNIGAIAAVDAKNYHERACRVDFVEELKSIYLSQEFLPKKDKSILTKKAIQSKKFFEHQQYLRSLDVIDRLKVKTIDELERHLLWRFRKT
ncbi:glycosyltransferase family 4 protein [Methylomonas sp. 2BW1-5-20]|uniref:glycosyltransferase family 4 protein n=1 Tax=Methylomonas sp. 2BW1-5-20 TaxID=3376686 RepID=UPI00404E8713